MATTSRNLRGLTVLLSGSTGMIGSRLTKRLRELDCTVIPLSTSLKEGSVRWAPEKEPGLLTSLPVEPRQVQAIVHLGGHPLQPLWTESMKRKVYDSRVKGTKVLVNWLKVNASPTKRVLITASGVGVYGAKPADYAGPAMTEKDAQTGAYIDLLDRVGRDSESACDPARASVRVCHARFGVVLDKDGGALQKMLIPFKLGLGGPMGSGEQRFPWVSLDDAVESIVFMLQNETVEGAYNVVSPGAEDTSQKRFAKALGTALNRPAFIPLPGFVLQTLLGKEAAQAMFLGSIKVRPEALIRQGFDFKDQNIEEYLNRLLR